MLTPRLVAELMRQRMGDPDASKAARYINLIPQALKATGRKVAADPYLRPLLTTDKGNTTLPLDAMGRVNLATGHTTYRFLSEYLDLGELYLLSQSPLGGDYASGSLTVVDAALTPASGYLQVQPGTVAATGTLTIRQGVAAMGSLTFASNPVNNETIDVNGATFTFRTTPTNPFHVRIGANKQESAANFVAVLNASSSPLINVATYTAGGLGSGVSSGQPVPPTVVSIVYDTLGVVGNGFTLADSLFGAITRGASTLTGGIDGVQNGETLNVNGVPVTFYRDPGPVPDVPTLRVPCYDDAGATATALANALEAAVDDGLTVASYAAVSNAVAITYDTLGYIGNTFALFVSSAGNITRSAATLLGGIGGVVEGETILINGVLWTFSNLTFAPSTHIRFGDPGETASFMATALNASSNPAINVATYTGFAGGQLIIVYDTPGVVGNSFTLAVSSGGAVTRSGATLMGGVNGGITNGETILVNGISWEFNNTPAAHRIPFDVGGDININAANIRTALAAATDPELTICTYSVTANVVTITSKTPGFNDNAFTTPNSSLYAVVGAAPTLEGGTYGTNVDGDTLYFLKFTDVFNNLDVVRFTTTGTLPGGLALLTDYYLIDKQPAPENGPGATYSLSSTPDGETLVNITSNGIGLLTMTKQSGNAYPLQKLPNPQLAHLPNYLQDSYDYYYIQGDTLAVLPVQSAGGRTYPAGSVGFAVPYYPATLAALPESEEIERMFLDKLYELALAPVNDAAQDAEK